MRPFPYHRLPQLDSPPKETAPATIKEVKSQPETQAKTAQPSPASSAPRKKSTASYSYIFPLLLVPFFLRNSGNKTTGAPASLRALSSPSSSSSSPFTALSQSLGTIMENPGVSDMLESVCPYLDESEQAPIHTLVGILRTTNTVKALHNHDYKIQGIASKTNLDPHERRMGIIRAMKPYVSQESLGTLETFEKVLMVFRGFQDNAKVMQDLRSSKNTKAGIEPLLAMANTIKPLLPEEQRGTIERFGNMFKIMETMDMMGAPKKEANTLEILPSHDTKIENKPTQDQQSLSIEEQQARIINAITPLLSEDQQKSMGTLLEMAKAFASQSSNP